MPYDAFGQAITKEQQLREEYWAANHKKRIKLGIVCLVILTALIILAGLTAVVGGIVYLVNSEDPLMNVMGIATGVLLGSMTVMALLWARF